MDGDEIPDGMSKDALCRRDVGVPVWSVPILKDGSLEAISVEGSSGCRVVHQKSLDSLYAYLCPAIAVREGS